MGWFNSAGSVVELAFVVGVGEVELAVEVVVGVSPDVSIAVAAVAILGSPARALWLGELWTSGASEGRLIWRLRTDAGFVLIPASFCTSG